MPNAPAVPARSSEIRLSIPPKNIKRLDDPFDSKRYIYEAQVPITEAAKLLIGRANPRDQNLKSKISRQIRESLAETPTWFHLKNRGIWVAAESAEYDNQTGILVMSCPQDGDKRFGAVDGGHTLANIQEFLKDNKEEGGRPAKTPYVMIHIRVGIEDELTELVETLNRSAQLKEYTLAAYRGEFAPLEELLRRESFSQEIDFRENGKGEFDIVDVLQRLSLFCNGIFPGKLGKHPTEAYASKAKCLDYYLGNQEEFLALAPILGDCFRLPDQIERILPEISASGRFGGYQFAHRLAKPALATSLQGVAPKNGVKSWERTHDVSTGVTFPLAASLRLLIQKRNGTISGWKTDPVEFFYKHGKELFLPITDASDRSPSILGKDRELWQRLYHLAYECLHPEE